MINGRTRVIGIVADPIGHVRTPQALNALMARWRGSVVHFGQYMLKVLLDHMADFLSLVGSRPAVGAGASSRQHKPDSLPIFAAQTRRFRFVE